MEFASLLEKKGIPEYLYKPVSQGVEQEIQSALSIISKVCQIFPANDQKPPALAEFFITVTVSEYIVQKLPVTY